MPKKIIIIIMSVFFLIVFFLLIYQSQNLCRTFKNAASKALNSDHIQNKTLLTENDIQHLPEPVQRYLAYTGVIGKEKVQNMHVVFEGEMKTDPQKDWIKISAEQYTFFDHPTRIFFIKGNLSGLPMVGLHSYTGGKAIMRIQLAGLITVADAKGPEMDLGETVTFFNDMCILAPATLIDPKIFWKTIDQHTVEAYYSYQGNQISALLYFDDQGRLVDFVSQDRSMTVSGSSYVKLPWSTPIKNYHEVNGMMLPDAAEAIWQHPESDYCYAKFKIKNIEYNISDI